MSKNIRIIFFSMLASIVIGIFNVKTIFNDCEVMVPILLTILGLCITSYTFILVPIQNITNGNKEKKDLVSNLLNEYKDNMIFIFVSCIILISLDLIYSIDFPLISNPTSINFSLFKISSLKLFFKLIIEDFFCILSLNSFYDIMQSIFILVSYSVLNKD